MSVLRLPQLSAPLPGEEPVEFILPRSKSESNRMLVLQAIAGADAIQIDHVSEARDTRLLRQALQQASGSIDVQDAGTAMRFALAYHAIRGNQVELRGTPRMHERPIGPLVEALRGLGARISYVNKEGYPPVRLKGFAYSGKRDVEVRGDISSQFITALLLCAPILPDGMRIHILGQSVSQPYILLTLDVLKRLGVGYKEGSGSIDIPATRLSPAILSVEPDWSAAGYAFSLVGLSGRSLFIPGLTWDTRQGDVELHRWFQYMGVGCWNDERGLHVVPLDTWQPRVFLDFSDTPDQAQTMAVYCAAKGIELEMTGVSTLKIKETDRMAALQSELSKLGCEVVELGDDRYRVSGKMHPPSAALSSHDDHRMAMSLAPLSALFPIEMDGAEAVAKSFPGFWGELSKLA